MAAFPAPSFGSLLRHHRLSAGLTQEELAERAGVSPRAIIALELGERRRPYRHTLELLTSALQLSPTEAEMLQQAAGYPTPRREHPRNEASLPAIELVGRSREPEAVQRFLSSATPPILMVTGEPGIGKTRLLQEATRLAMVDGFTVLQGGAQRRSGQEPYAPMLAMLSHSLADLPPHRLRAALAGCAWLPHLLPELMELVNAPLTSGVLPPDQERRLVFAAVGRYLANRAGAAGTLLILDDLQWASPDGLDLLAALLDRQNDTPIRVLGAYRDTETGHNHPLSLLLAELVERQLVDRLSLAPLPDSDARLLLDRLLPSAGEGESLKQRILERTGGVPFFLVSCVHGLQTGDAGEGVPWTVAQSIRQRVAALPQAAQDALRAAAILGRVCQRSILLHMVAAPESEVLAGLDAVCRSRLLLPEGRAAYRFAHDVVREAIEADLGEAQRMLLHRKAAEVLEALPESEHGPEKVRRAAELAWHFREGDELERAGVYAISAADGAIALFAHEEAERQYRMALELSRESQEESREAEVLEKLGNLLWCTGRYEESLSMLQRAVARYEITANLDALGRVGAKIGWTHSHRGAPEAGVTLLEPLAARLEAMGPTAGLVDVYDALFHLYLRQDRIGELAPAARHAAAAAQALGDESLLVRGELNHGIALCFEDRPEEALQVLTGIIPRAEEAHDAVTLGRVLIWTVNSCANSGALERGREYAQRAVEVTERIGSPPFLTATLANHGQLLFLLGEWGDARACGERALEVAATASSWAGDAHCTLAELALAEGSWDELCAHLERGRELSTHTGTRMVSVGIEVVLAQKELMDGLPTAALARLRPLEQHYPERRQVSLVIAEARLESGDLARAAQMVAASVGQARAGKLRLALVGWLRLNGMLHTQHGQWGSVLTAFDEALSLAQQMPYPYGAGRILYELGRMYAAQGDHDQAESRLTQALSHFQRLGARPYVERAAEALNRLVPRQ